MGSVWAKAALASILFFGVGYSDAKATQYSKPSDHLISQIRSSSELYVARTALLNFPKTEGLKDFEEAFEALEQLEYSRTVTKRWKGNTPAFQRYQVWKDPGCKFKHPCFYSRHGQFVYSSDGRLFEATPKNVAAVDHAVEQLERTDMPPLELSRSSNRVPSKLRIEGPSVLVDYVHEYCRSNPSVEYVTSEHNPDLIIEWHSLGSLNPVGQFVSWKTANECIEHYLSKKYARPGTEEVFVALMERNPESSVQRNFIYINRVELSLAEPFDIVPYKNSLILLATLLLSSGCAIWGLLGLRSTPEP